MITVNNVLERVRRARAQTEFYPRSNETYYPAAWRYGDGAGDASTSAPYDVRKSQAAEYVLTKLAEEHDVTVPDLYEDWETMGTRDIARTIASAINLAITEDENAEENVS